MTKHLLYFVKKLNDSSFISLNAFLTCLFSMDFCELMSFSNLKVVLCFFKSDLCFNVSRVDKNLCFKFLTNTPAINTPASFLHFSFNFSTFSLLAKISEILTWHKTPITNFLFANDFFPTNLFIVLANNKDLLLTSIEFLWIWSKASLVFVKFFNLKSVSTKFRAVPKNGIYFCTDTGTVGFWVRYIWLVRRWRLYFTDLIDWFDVFAFK